MQPVSGLEMELHLMGQSVLVGAVLFVVYDLIRILRRIFPHGIIWISLEDFFYWSIAGIWFFLRLCQVNDGIVRGYILLGMAFGAWMYYRLCSRFLMKRITKVVILLKKRLKKFWKLATIQVNRFLKSKNLRKVEQKDESETKKSP